MTKKLSYLAPELTHSWQAAVQYLDLVQHDMCLEARPTIRNALERLLDEEPSEMAIVPYNNHTIGLIQETLDPIFLLGLTIVDAISVRIVNSVGVRHGCSDYSTIYSKDKALSQCTNWISEHYPEAEQVPTGSTAAAAKLVAEGSGIAIARPEAMKEYGLKVLCDDASDAMNGNYTDFYVVAKENGDPKQEGLDYLTMVAVSPHIDRVGLIHDISGVIAWHGLNMTDLRPRPMLGDIVVPNNKKPRMFYIEMEAHYSDDNFRKCMDSLRDRLAREGVDADPVKIMGSYRLPEV